MDRLLWYLFAGSRGGPTRIQIMRELLDEPQNAHQLAKDLGRDYKTIEYNLRVLMKNVIVVSDDPKAYGALYHPSKNFLAALETFERIAAKAATKQQGKGRTPKGTPAGKQGDPTVGET